MAAVETGVGGGGEGEGGGGEGCGGGGDGGGRGWRAAGGGEGRGGGGEGVGGGGEREGGGPQSSIAPCSPAVLHREIREHALVLQRGSVQSTCGLIGNFRCFSTHSYCIPDSDHTKLVADSGLEAHRTLQQRCTELWRRLERPRPRQEGRTVSSSSLNGLRGRCRECVHAP